MASTAPTYDPVTTATNLATMYVQDRQTIIKNQGTLATATDKALTSLSSAMSALESAMSSLTTKKSVLATSATFSSTVGTATANSTAVPGTYSFYVEQLATANQAQYSNLADATPLAEAGTISVSVGATTFAVDLSTADKSGDGVLSVKELAAAINTASGNTAKVTASTVTVGGAPTLVLTSNATGAANTVSIDGSALPNGALKTALGNAANRADLVAAKDAIVYLGDKATGTKLQQASNTYDVVDGVSMTFTKAQAVGETPVTLTVATDNTGTAANLQGFVDGWNKLISTLNSLTSAGSVTDGTSAGIFHADAGIQTLETRMQALLRQKVDGLSLANYGITGQRDGTLTLDSTRLTKALAANPEGLNKIMGNTGSTTSAGVMGDLDKLMNQWTNSATGQISQRRDVNAQLQESLTDRQSRLDQQYDSAYTRYLAQFTALQTLQSQMSSNTSIFDALFAKDE